MSRKRSPSRRTSSRMRAAVHLHLSPGRPGGKELHCPLRLPLQAGSVGEQGLFQEVQIRRPSSSLRRQVLHLAGDAALPGRPQQLGGRSAGGEKMPVPPSSSLQMVTGEGDRHRMGLLQQAGEHLYLLGE